MTYAKQRTHVINLVKCISNKEENIFLHHCLYKTWGVGLNNILKCIGHLVVFFHHSLYKIYVLIGCLAMGVSSRVE
jgi:hypothetical protein